MTAGETGPAIRNYEKSLELQPDNRNAAEMLKKLRVGKELIRGGFRSISRRTR